MADTLFWVTIISAVVAVLACGAAWKGALAWREAARFDARKNALATWTGKAAEFRGRLKFVYAASLKWPEDKEQIESLAAHYWVWIATWPAVRASTSGALLSDAELLWNDVNDSWHSAINGGSLEGLGGAVERVYTSDLLARAIRGKS